jgi:hypothetical protein
MNMRRIFVLAALFFSACVTAPKSRTASEYLLTTDLATKTVFDGIQEALGAYKYKMKTLDLDAGILVFEPRNFSFDRGGQKVPAKQTLYVRQEGGSVKLRITYECNYVEDFVPCHLNDKDVASKISRIEPAIVKAIKPVLMKHN